MTTLPHDVPDLELAPLVLELDARINKLGQLSKHALEEEVALDSDLPDWTRALRESALLRTVSHFLDCHGWVLAWHPRGLALSHAERRVVLGIPATFVDFLSGAPLMPVGVGGRLVVTSDDADNASRS